jgi:hypothetical protein
MMTNLSKTLAAAFAFTSLSLAAVSTPALARTTDQDRLATPAITWSAAAAREGNGHADVASYAMPEGNGHADVS